MEDVCPNQYSDQYTYNWYNFRHINFPDYAFIKKQRLQGRQDRRANGDLYNFSAGH